MKKILNFYSKNKKIINIIVIFIILIIISIIVIFSIIHSTNFKEEDFGDNSSYQVDKIILSGKSIVTINQGEKYNEPGYSAITLSGEDKTDEVIVTSNLDINKIGEYTIIYSIGEKKVVRTIRVIKKSTDLTLSIKGDSKITLNDGDTYYEPGYLAYDTIDGDLTDLVVVKGEVDTNTPGTYTIVYEVINSSGDTKSMTRTVVVKEIPFSINITKSKTDYTNDNVVLTIEIKGSNFLYIKYPNGTVSKNTNSQYEITKNGNYVFYIYDINGEYVTKEIEIKNIDKEEPTGTCTAKIEDGKTEFTVVANDGISGIKNYEYYGNNLLLNRLTINNYQHYTNLNTAYVILYDKALNSKMITCQIEKEYDLEVHYIDVGREDAILIRSSDKTIFIDGGSYNKKSIITPYLQKLGITHIDVMIGSHLHYNHIQAQADLLENFTIDKIYYPQDLNTCYSTYCEKADQKYILEAIKKYNKEISIMKVDDNINIGDMNIFCISPVKFQTKSQNQYRQNYNSLNFILTYGDTKFMFTGDHMQYSNILKKFDKAILDIDVLKYPHHGNASLGKEMVNALSPKYVILTSAKDELASKNEKTYLKNVGASFYYSYKHGNILLISDGKDITVKTKVSPSDYKR